MVRDRKAVILNLLPGAYIVINEQMILLYKPVGSWAQPPRQKVNLVVC